MLSEYNNLQKKVPLQADAIMLAEEASEVAQAALKLARCCGAGYKCRKDEGDVIRDLYEEMADMMAMFRNVRAKLLATYPEEIAKFAEEEINEIVNYKQSRFCTNNRGDLRRKKILYPDLDLQDFHLI